MGKSKSKSAQANGAAQSSKHETPQAKSKEVAKQAVKAHEASKKSKKVQEPSSDLDSDDSGDDESDEGSSASSASSDDESEEEAPKQAKSNGVKTNGVQSNGVSKAEPAGEAESSDSSESSDAAASDSEDEDDEEEAAPVPKANVQAPKAPVDESDDDSEDASDDGSDDDEEDKMEIEKPKGAVSAPAVGGKVSKVDTKDDDSEDDHSADSEDDSEDSGDSDESEEEEKPAPKSNKRKADAEPASPVKKTKNAGADDLDDATKKNLFVGHLSYNVDEEWLRREFEPYGELTRVVHMTDRETQRPRGFGYIEFANAEEGVAAQEAMNGREIDGRAINVDFSRPKTDQPPRQDRAKQYGDRVRSPPSATIFVANLAFSATSDSVGEEFGQHADVVGVRLPTDRETGEPKGFGYVEFTSIPEAEKAFAAMEGQPIMGRVPRLDYSTPRPDRNGDSPGGRGGFNRGGGRGGFDRGGRGGGRGRGDRGGRGGGRGRGGSTNRGGFGDFQGKKMSFS